VGRLQSKIVHVMVVQLECIYCCLLRRNSRDALELSRPMTSSPDRVTTTRYRFSISSRRCLIQGTIHIVLGSLVPHQQILIARLFWWSEMQLFRSFVLLADTCFLPTAILELSSTTTRCHHSLSMRAFFVQATCPDTARD
jgi:hypothetical protein